MSVIITGACGHLGRYVCKTFLNAGYDVVGFDYPTKNTKKVSQRLKRFSKKLNRSFEMVWGDISQKDSLKPAFDIQEIQGIVHLAFILPPYSEMDPDRSRAVNVDGTKHVISLAEQQAPEAPFVFASSLAAYGPINPDEPILTVDKPLKPYNHYNTHKIECERMIQNSTLNWRILRLSAVANPEMKATREMMEYSLTIPLNTKIQPVHVKDVATAMLHAVEREAASRKIFLIAGPEDCRITYKEYIYRQLAATFPNLSEDEIPWEKYGTNPYYLHWADTTESQKILEFQNHTFDDYISDLEKSQSFLTRLLLRIPPIRKRAIAQMFPE